MTYERNVLLMAVIEIAGELTRERDEAIARAEKAERALARPGSPRTNSENNTTTARRVPVELPSGHNFIDREDLRDLCVGSLGCVLNRKKFVFYELDHDDRVALAILVKKVWDDWASGVTANE